MRLEPHPDSDGYKVRMNNEELHQLVAEYDESPKKRIALRLMAHVGLRSHEVLDVTKSHIRPMDVDGEYKLRVWKGKDGKYREAYLPADLATEMRSYANAIGLNDEEPIVDVTRRTLQRWVKRAAEGVGEDEGWEYVTTHDLRRSWGHNAVESDVLPTLVQEWGGWDDWQTFKEHYLGSHSDEVAAREARKMFS